MPWATMHRKEIVKRIEEAFQATLRLWLTLFPVDYSMNIVGSEGCMKFCGPQPALARFFE
jgi:hypothetical protein